MTVAATLKPAEIAQGQLDAYNAQDLDAYMAFFAEDCVVADLNGPVTMQGAAAIRERYAGSRFEIQQHLTVDRGGWHLEVAKKAVQRGLIAYGVAFAAVTLLAKAAVVGLGLPAAALAGLAHEAREELALGDQEQVAAALAKAAVDGAGAEHGRRVRADRDGHLRLRDLRRARAPDDRRHLLHAG